MTALKKIILSIVLLGSFYWLSWQYKPDMTIVYPDDCSFTIDSKFSYQLRQDITLFIDGEYKKNKKPSSLLQSIESEFPSIKSIVIDMHNPDQLNFTIQSYQPEFVLNDSLVVCQEGQIFERSIFADKIISKLENITYHGSLRDKDITRLVKFITSLSDPILKDFSIRWLGKYNVWLDQKQGQDLSLLVGYRFPPTMSDIAECRKLRGQIIDKPCKNKRGKPCVNTTTWVCDLRFDQQIVLFSTNKGG